MRDFFLNLLEKLDKLAGLKQLDKIYAVHGDDILGAKNEIKVLLDVLCRVSLQFPFIPDDDQQKIITQAVITEDFPSLNGHVVYTWLNRQKDKYFKQSHHEEKVVSAEPLTGEARDAKLQEWMNSLANAQQMIIATKKVDAEKEGREWISEVERKGISSGVKYTTPEDIEAHNAKIRALQERTFRERNPGASEEEVYLFLQSIKKYEAKVPNKTL